MVIKEIKVKTVLTISNLPIAGYSVNPYVGCSHACRYCYADFIKRFTGHTEKWGEFIDVKYWDKISNPHKYDNSTIMIGSVTDGYIPQELKYRRTRQFLKEMQGSKCNLIIITKSDLVLEDLDLIKTFKDPMIAWSIDSLNEDFKKDMDHAPSIKRRIEAMRVAHENGIRTTCFISPIFPEITDVIALIDEIKDIADYIWLENLNLRGAFRPEILNYIKDKFPSLYPLYDAIYNHKDNTYWENLDKKVSAYCHDNNLPYLINEEPFNHNELSKPIIVNYFYHSEIKQSAKKKN